MSAVTSEAVVDTRQPGIPFGRLVLVEIRKMFNTRSGFWLMASVAIIAALATLSVIAFVPDKNIEYSMFTGAIGFPLSVMLPIIAILAVTSEWSQRTGLVTFTLVPHRGVVVWSKLVAAVLIGVVAVPVAFAIGALGNVIGSALNGVDVTWDLGIREFFLFLLGNALGLLIGFMLGALFRNTPAAIVGYFVYSLVLPIILSMLAAFQDWFKDLQPWIDFNYAQSPLIEDGSLSGEQWAQLTTSGVIWLVLPLAFGIWMIRRAEVK